MTDPKDNVFAPTLERFEDFLSSEHSRNTCGRSFRVVAEDGSEMEISYSMLRQFVARHRELGAKISRFRRALAELM